MPRGKKAKNTAESICAVEGCNRHVTSYTRHGRTLFKNKCAYHYAEYKRSYDKRGFTAHYANETKKDMDFAREWNRKNPIKPECVMGIIAAFKNMSRIPSGGRINKIRIEGE